MNLQINDRLFVVGGATSGFGKAISLALIAEGAKVIAIARNTEKLKQLQSSAPAQIEYLDADITENDTITRLELIIGDRSLDGILVNAGGPPAKSFLETTIADWDAAYKTLLRWKIIITQRLIPKMIAQQYGRILYIESSSVKQPLENLVLSNSIRLAVVGFVKTLSQEIAKTGVTLNILGPGSHDTAAIERVYQKKAEQTGKTSSEVRAQAIQQIPVGRLGRPEDLASLATWLLSPVSGNITGQTISIDGGSIKGVFG